MSKLELYTWPTPNGWKVHIMLEELGLDYEVKPIDIMKGDQFEPAYLTLNPNNKMPTLVDPEGFDGMPHTIFESGAILWYLAEKHGKFLPSDPAGKSVTLQWLMFQMAGFGPMLGQAHHFRQYAPEHIEYAYNRYTNEAKRLYAVLNQRLSEVSWVNGQDYSIADMAIFCWARLYERQGVEEADIPDVKAWLDKIEARPAVIEGLKILADRRKTTSNKQDKEGHKLLFGADQFKRRQGD